MQICENNKFECFNINQKNKLEYLKLLRKSINNNIIILNSNFISICATSLMTYDMYKHAQNNFLLSIYIGSIIYMGFCFDIYYEDLKDKLEKVKKLKMEL